MQGVTCSRRARGEGYGADLIAGVARRVVGLDYDDSAVAHVKARYPRVDMRQGNLADLPFEAGTFDVVVNFQVIEHLWDQGQFVAECARVLRPSGVLLMSTPNRITFSPGRDTPINPFHTRELNAAELTELLTDTGSRSQAMLGVFHGPRLAELDARHGGSIIDAQIDRALADAPWPADLLADVTSIRTDDFDLLERGRDSATSMRASTWWPSRCDVTDDRGSARRTSPGSSPWSCTPTCRGWRTTAAGRSARNGSTSRGRRPTCR